MDPMENIKKVFVVGTGISGINASNFLLDHGKEVIIYDQKEDIDIAEIKEKLHKGKVEILVGEFEDSLLDNVDLFVPSPGLFPESPLFQRFVKKNISIWGEIELAYRFDKGSVIAITGTNGKTTTTTLVGDLVKALNGKDKTFVVGNIGKPYTKEVEKTSKDTISVAEISSYQLETCIDFHPHISAILNITPDHLDRHHTMDEYERVKELITMNQTKEDFCILNYDDDRLRDFGLNKCPATVLWFGRQKAPEEGLYFKGNHIYIVAEGKMYPLIATKEIKLLGSHNYENIMAALCVARAIGLAMDKALEVVRNFTAVAHRIEFVGSKSDVKYYNDSKGTNPDAAIKAIEAMERPIVLIAGGYDKGGDFDEYVSAFQGKVKELVVLGATADKIEASAIKSGFTNIKKAKDLKEAVDICYKDAVAGDCVLLSPACASWDMFKSFEERGRLFKKYVSEF